MFVGDVENGTFYHVKLNQNRTGLSVTGSLGDKLAETPSKLRTVIFGQSFHGITDIKVDPDGYLYILSLTNHFYYPTTTGDIFRIVPNLRANIPCIYVKGICLT